MLTNKRIRNFIVLSIIVVLCLIVATVSFRNGELTQSFKTRTIDFFEPVQEKIYGFFHPIVIFFNGIRDYINLRSKYEALLAENAQLRQEYSSNINLEIENNSLRDLLELDIRREYKTIAAKVIGYSQSEWQSEIILDAGKSDGITEGLGVINQQGLVGIVVSSGDRSCNVRLLDDPGSSIGVRILSSRKIGILEGSNDNKIYLNNIPAEDAVFKGDMIMTSEFSDYLPSEILIGRVSVVRNVTGNPYKEIEVEPFVDFKELENVLVIKN